MDCASCGNENPEDSLFCEGCGERLERACPSCDASVSSEARFCRRCGHTLSSDGPAPRDYTPKHLADKILTQKSAIEGERKQVTVFFADLKSSMELSAAIDPELWHGILDQFFQILADGIHRFEGTINQYTGDGIMALFGAPIAHEDHAQRSCYAALGLLDDLQLYAREVKREHGLAFSVRMGINSGDVVVGKIGDDLRMDYTAQGPTVGLAARMEELASPDTVYLTGSTAKLVTGYFELEDLGEFGVKGVNEPVPVFELKAAGALRTRFDVSRARGLTRFVGRDADMQTLETALAQAETGSGQVVGVVADAGTGKSRLCFEFLELCRSRGLTVLEGRAVSHGKNIPYLPMLQAFRAYFGIGDQDSDRAAREKIAGRLLLIDEGFRATLPVLFEFFGVPDPERPPPAMDPDAKQRQIISVNRRLVQGGEGDLVVTLIEDLHWIDAGSEALLEEWVDAIAGHRGLLVVNFRPEYHSGWMQKSYYRQLPLAALGAEAIRELLDDLLGNDTSIRGLADVIHERTAGNPFFTEEVVQGLIESGKLEGSRGAYRLVTPVDRLAVPGTVHAVLAARIDRLAERDKQVLQPAAVIGKEFSEPILCAVADIPRQELTDALHTLKSSEFIYEESLYPVAEYAFKHPLTQEVALSSQLGKRRRRTHAAVAAAVEEANKEKLDEHSALLAHHWEEAGETLNAMRWHRRAAEWLARSNPAGAHAHWGKVRVLADALPGDPEALEYALLARETLISNLWRVGSTDAEIETLREEGMAIASRLDSPRARFEILTGYSIAKYVSGMAADSLEPSRQALELAEALGDVPALSDALAVLQDAHYLGGTLDDAIEYGDRMLEVAGDDLNLGIDRFNVSLVPWTIGRSGFIRFWKGEPARGLEDLERAMSLGRSIDQFEVVSWLLSRYPELEELTGEPHQALARTQQALECAERAGSPIAEAGALAAIGHAQLVSGRAGDAIAPLQEACDVMISRNMGINWCPIFRARLAEAHLAAGDLERARTEIDGTIATCTEGGYLLFEGRAHLAKARILLAEDATAARESIEASLSDAERLFRQTGAAGFSPFVLEERARLAQAQGDEERSRALLEKAREAFRSTAATGHLRRLAK